MRKIVFADDKSTGYVMYVRRIVRFAALTGTLRRIPAQSLGVAARLDVTPDRLADEERRLTPCFPLH